MSAHSALETTLGEFAPVPGSMADYEVASDLTGVFSDPPAGLAIHFAGPIDGTVLSGSIWEARQSAREFFVRSAGEGLTELVHRMATAGRNSDITYKMEEVTALRVGDAASDFVNRPRGEAGSAVLLRTPHLDALGAARPGLILATVVPTDSGTLHYEFLDHEPERIGEATELIRLHSLTAYEPALATVRRESQQSG